MAEQRRLKFWGWGHEGQTATPEEVRWLEARWAGRFGLDGYDVVPPPRLDEIELRAPRVRVPDSLREVCSTDKYDRAAHTYGKSFPEVARAFHRDFANPPDVVAFPRDERDVSDLLDWCAGIDACAIPFGGGSSVAGGITPPEGDGGRAAAVVTVDLRHLNRVLEVDKTSRAARIEGGIFGPALEAALKPHGLTLRHFPQSFEFSTLGGWIATRSGGHFATLYTHIDDLVEGLRVVTPAGVAESFRLPGSGAGPSPDRLMIGSEGILGIITQAWVRLQDRPTHAAAATVRFKDFFAGAEAVRAIAQAGLYPANCRILDAEEAGIAGAGDGAHAMLVLGFESADHPLDAWMARAIECAADHGGEVVEQGTPSRSGPAGIWRNYFLRAPFYREELTARAIIRETFETATTWDRFPDLHAAVMAAGRRAIKEATGHEGSLTCRFTHVYPDGPAPYFTFHARGDKERLVEQFWAIKRAVSDVLVEHRATITHHHAVGRYHRPWYDRQRPEPFASQLRAAKKAVDPKGILNPGVLIDT